jgi:hypothetical protein
MNRAHLLALLGGSALAALPALAQDAAQDAAVQTAAVATAPPAAAAPSGPITLTASLGGNAEVGHDGDPDGRGLAKLTLTGTRLCYDVEYHRVAPVIAAHVHAGAEGKDGAPVVTLKLDPDEYIKGCTSVAPDVAAALAASPKDYYVNVHTTELKDGAIRGQLDK